MRILVSGAAGFLGSHLVDRLLADLVIALTGSRSKLVRRPLPEDDPRQRRPAIGRAARDPGWRPRIALEQGLKRTIAYFDAELRRLEECNASS